MKHHRYGCYGWLVWPKYAHAYGWSDSRSRNSGEPREESVYEHRSRSGSRGSSGFGARRPLRYLSYQLDLDETQRRRLATAIEKLKVAREQAALDEKKTLGSVADLLSGTAASTEAIRAALAPRVQSAEQLQATAAAALEEIVAVLDSDQREEFAYLLRTGAFRI